MSCSVDSLGHVATAPHDPGERTLLSRRDIRALETRLREERSAKFAAPSKRRNPRPASLRQRAASGSGIALVALFAISTSLPALAIDSKTPETSATSAPKKNDLQSISAAGTTTLPIERDGFAITDAPAPASYTDIASTGEWASLSAGQLSDQGWALPVLGRISSPFGSRPNKPVDGVGDFHSGTDIAAPCGRPVFAATDGKVVDSGYQGSYGNWVLIDHGDGVETGYAHNSELLVDAGQLVVAGEIIAVVGSTGASSGCHVHYETRVDGERIDAEQFMSARGVSLD